MNVMTLIVTENRDMDHVIGCGIEIPATSFLSARPGQRPFVNLGICRNIERPNSEMHYRGFGPVDG